MTTLYFAAKELSGTMDYYFLDCQDKAKLQKGCRYPSVYVTSCVCADCASEPFSEHLRQIVWRMIYRTGTCGCGNEESPLPPSYA